MTSKDHVNAFLALEAYLCQELCLSHQELNVRIMDWAAEDPARWKTWEDCVRNGERLKELQMYAKAVVGTPTPSTEKKAKTTDDLWA